MAHVVATIASIALFGYLAATSSSQADIYTASTIGVLVLFGLPLLSLATIPALFKDSTYLRETSRRWQPQWWYYIGGGLAPAVVFFIASDLLGGGVGGIALGLLGLLVGTVAMNAVYLYRRHQNIGVP